MKQKKKATFNVAKCPYLRTVMNGHKKAQKAAVLAAKKAARAAKKAAFAAALEAMKAKTAVSEADNAAKAKLEARREAKAAKANQKFAEAVKASISVIQNGFVMGKVFFMNLSHCEIVAKAQAKDSADAEIVAKAAEMHAEALRYGCAIEHICGNINLHGYYDAPVITGLGEDMDSALEGMLKCPLRRQGVEGFVNTCKAFAALHDVTVHVNMDINAARKIMVYGQRTAFYVPLLKIEKIGKKMVLTFDQMRQADCVLVRHGYVSDWGKCWLPLTVGGKNVLKEREHGSLDLIEIEGSALKKKIVDKVTGRKVAYLATLIERNKYENLARLICGVFDGKEYFGFYVPYRVPSSKELIFVPVDCDVDAEDIKERALDVATVKALAAWAADHDDVIYERYVNFAVSVAGQRRQTFSYLRVQKKDATLEEILAIRHDALDSIHLGAYSFLEKCNAGVEMKLTKAIKKAARLTLALTNSARGGIVHRIAVFCGEFATHNGGKLSRDGNALFSAEWFIRFCRQEMGVHLTLDDARALGLQGRVATIKAFFLSKTNEELELIIKEFAKNYGVKIVFQNWPDPEDVATNEEFEKLLQDAENGKLEDTILMLGCEEGQFDVDMFVDMCALKCFFGMAGYTDSNGVHHSMTLNIMAIEKTPDFRMNTSNQILGGCMSAEGFLEFALGLGLEQIDHALEMKESSPKNISSYRDVAGYFGDTLLSNLNQKLAYSIPECRKNMVDSLLTANLRCVNRFNFKTSGFYAKMLPEPAFWFCSPDPITVEGVEYESISAYLLRTNRTADDKGNVWVHVECFSPDVAGGVKAIGIRHPKLSPGEYLNITFVSRKLMYKRIAELLELGLISVAVANYLRDCFRHLKSSNIYVPSWDADIMNLLGDADFDGDTIGILLGEEWVKLYSQIPNIFVDKGEQRKLINEAVVTFGNEIMQQAYVIALNNGNKAIGQVVIYAYMLACVRQDILCGNLTEEIWQKILYNIENVDQDVCYMQTEEGLFARMEYEDDEMVEMNNGKDDAHKVSNRAFIELFKNNRRYVRMFANSETCDADEVDKFVQAVYDAGLVNLENIVDIFADMAIVLSTVACRVIDSAKKPESVHVPLFGILRQLFRAGMSQRVNIEVVNDQIVHTPIQTGLITVEEMMGNLDNKDDEKGVEDGALVDTMSGSAYRGTYIYVTNDQMCVMKNLLGKYLAEKLQKLLDDTRELAANGVQTEAGNRGAVDSLSSIATLYNAVIINDKGSIDMMKPYFVAMARQLTKGFPKAVRMKYLLEACKKENEETGKKELVNKFWKDFVTELVFFAAPEDFEITEELYSFDGDTVMLVGDKVRLENGRDKKRRKAGGLFTAERLTGEFEVAKSKSGQALIKTTVHDYADQFYNESEKKFVIDLDVIKTIDALKEFKGMFTQNEFAYIDLTTVDPRNMDEYAERYGEAANFASIMLRRSIKRAQENNRETRFVLDGYGKGSRGHLQILCADGKWRDLAVFYIPWGDKMIRNGQSFQAVKENGKKVYFSRDYLDGKDVFCDHVLCIGDGKHTRVLVAGAMGEDKPLEQANL